MIKIAIVEDNEAYRTALYYLIKNENDLRIVYTANSCENILEAFTKYTPDVVIMDIELPKLNGIEGVRLIKGSFADAKIFMLTTFEDDDQVFDAIKAGAVGYLVKSEPPERIIEAIRKVYNGEAVMNGRIAAKILQYFSAKETKEKHKWEEYHLTTREKEILELLMKGLSYKEIAAKCFISNATVFTHVRKIYSKLDVHSRAEITNKFK